MPEEGEYVLCTVKKILFHSVFATLDEYENKEGMIHISEVSPGRIRNLRDYVKEGKKIVCKVLRIKKDRGHIDLSLRRVSVSMRKKKNAELKREEKAEKIMELIARGLKTDMKTLYNAFGNKVWEEYGSLYNFFEEIINDESCVSEVGVPKEYVSYLIKVVKDKIKPPTVEIEKDIELKSEAPNGIEIIKEALKRTLELAKQKKYELQISYLSAPKYRFKIISKDYKSAEKTMQELIEKTINYVVSKKGYGEVKK